MREVREERSGWRDEEISKRHRQWGYNCPGVDLDFVMAEYNYGKPVAIVEYKHKRAMPPKVDHPTYSALVALADGYKDGPLPCFIATYDPDDWSFVVRPLNESAARFYAIVDGQRISEQRFVRSLYVLRKRKLTKDDEAAIAALNPETNAS